MSLKVWSSKQNNDKQRATYEELPEVNMIIRDRSVEETEGILVSRAIWNQMAADIEQLKSQVKVIVSLLAAEADPKGSRRLQENVQPSQEPRKDDKIISHYWANRRVPTR